VFARAFTAVIVAIFATAAAVHLLLAKAVPPDSDVQQSYAGAPSPDVYSEAADSIDPAPPAITIRTDLDRTATIEGYLMQVGLTRDEARAWAYNFENAAQSNLLRRGHAVTVFKDSETGAMTGFKYDVDDRVQIFEASLGQGVIKAYQQPIRYSVRPVSMAFEVHGESFRDSAVKNHLPQPVVETLEDAFSSRYDLDHLAAGTAIKLIYEEHVSRDGVHRIPGDVSAAEIRLGNRVMKAFAFRDEHGRAHLYDEEGHALGQQFLRFPVNFQYISSGFTMHRYHPILHSYRPHLGVDLAAAYGTPVKAIADGRVESEGWCGELGNCIRIEHDNSTISIYGHLSKIDSKVRPGSYIKIGQMIGNVGSTGLSTGPHLHFAIEKRGEIVDPLAQKIGVHHEVSARMKGLFENFKAHYQVALAKLPNLGPHFATAVASRKPPISPLADQYHVTVANHVTVTNHAIVKTAIHQHRHHPVEAATSPRVYDTAFSGM
jgi:murein DD-endopeptidase MepM/ murein hydrolase activator NlpD